MALEVFKLFGSILVKTDEAENSIKKTEEKSNSLADSFVSGVKHVAKWGAAIATAAGTAGIAVGTLAIKSTQEFTTAMNQLQASTGATNEEMEGLADVTKEVYGNNFGENFDDVANAVGSINKNLWLTGDSLQQVTEYALGFRDTFDVDVNESTRAAKALMDNFGISAEEAFNLMVQGQQKGLDFSGELIDNINEYSVQFSKLGLDAEDMFRIFYDGTQAGAFNLDKIGDAVKEFSIRVIDGSKTTKEGFSELGLNADEMANKFSAGGETARDAFYQVVDAIGAMDDPLQQNIVGTDLFGTMWEDLGPTVVTQLSTMSDEFNKTVDSADQLNKIKYNDFGSAIEGIKRQLVTNLLIPFGEAILPSLNNFANWFKDEGIPKIEEFLNKIKEHMPDIEKTVTTVFSVASKVLGEFIENIDLIIPLLAELGIAFGVFKIAMLIQKSVKAFKDFKLAIDGGKSAMAAFNFITGANPIALVVIAVAGFIALLTILYNKCEWFRDAVNGIGEWIVNFFTVTIPEAWQELLQFIGNIPQWFSEKWEVIKQVFIDGWNAIVEFFTVTIPEWIDSIINWIQQLPDRIAYQLGVVIGNIIQFGLNIWTWITEDLPQIIQGIIDWFSELPGRIWEWLVNTISNIIQWGSDMKTKADEWVSSTINSIINWFSELPGRIWNWLVATVEKVKAWGSSLWSAGKNAAGELWDSIVSTIEGLPRKMLDIGKNIVYGIWDGIVGAKDWLWGKIKGFGNSIVSGIKDTLGIHSPSRVMRDEVGKYMAQGIAVGFDSEIDDTNKSITKSLNSTIRATVDTASYETDENNQKEMKFETLYSYLKMLITKLDILISKSGFPGGEDLARFIAPYQGVFEEWEIGRS